MADHVSVDRAGKPQTPELPNASPTVISRIDADWLNNPDLQRVFRVLNEAGYVVRAVGGAVRDSVLRQGMPIAVADVDLATDATPAQVIEAMAGVRLRTVPTGLSHGTVTVISGDTTVEVTTLRTDVRTDGRHAEVAFTEDWFADAQRRDFTINAIYCDPDGTIFDPLSGIADLACRRLRFIADPTTRIREDYLRILRYFRFVAQLPGAELIPGDLLACTRERNGLLQLSAERVRSEILRLLGEADAMRAVSLLQRHGLLSLVLPTAIWPERLGRAIALQARFRDILKASDAVSGQIPAAASGPVSGPVSGPASISTLRQDAMLQLAALAVSHTGDATRLAVRLRLSNRESTDLSAYAAIVERGIDLLDGDLGWKGQSVEYGRDLSLRSALLSVASQTTNLAGVRQSKLTDRLREIANWAVPEFPVQGRDLIAMGYRPGPEIGIRLHELRAKWAASGYALLRAELLSDVAQPEMK